MGLEKIKNQILNFIQGEEEKNNNKIITVLGKTGSGKTLYQTEEFVLPALIEGLDIYCCYWLNWKLPNYHYFQPKDFDEIADKRNAVIVFDEVAQSFDPRDWEREDGRVRSFFQLHRHRHLDIICNTQDISLVAKTIGTQTHKWILCEENNDSLIILLIKKILGIKRKGIKIDLTQMTIQQIKKMAMGWEIGEVYNPEKEDNNFKSIKYDIEKLVHRELNQYKIEIVHKYCPRCKSRQGEQIKAEKTDEICEFNPKTKQWELKKEEFCPKHHNTKLIIRESGIYDTDYEPEIKEKKVIFKPFCEQMVMREYKGELTKEQNENKKNLEKNFFKEKWKYKKS